MEDAFDSDEEEEEEDEAEEMEVDKVKKKWKNRKYANQIMLSEWMMEVPPDFTEKWTMVPCPVGRRALLIASKVASLMLKMIDDKIVIDAM